MKLKVLIAYAIEKWGFRLTMDQAYRTKVRAMEKIEGATRDRYKHLRRYAAEIIEKKNKNNNNNVQAQHNVKGRRTKTSADGKQRGDDT